MDILANLRYVLFSIGTVPITLGQLIGFVLLILVVYLVYRVVINRLLPRYFSKNEVELKQRRRTRSIVLLIGIFIILLGGLYIGKLDIDLFPNHETVDFRLSTIIQVLLIFQIARLMDWLISKVMLHNYYVNRDAEKKKKDSPKTIDDEIEGKASKTTQYIVYLISILLILNAFNFNYTFFDIPNRETPDVPLTITSIIFGFLILLAARLFAWLMIQLVLYSYYKRKSINIGSQYAINQLLKYIIYTIAAFITIDSIGIDMTLIWGGAAALLVGIGLGLQQTFNDLISGIILLFERTVEVGDVVNVNELIGTVKKIGLRTSLVETFDNITVIVPNSKLIVDNVINWSHYDNKARFHINIGVAYGSNTALVKKLLLRVARENIYVLDYPMPIVRFINFGDSSLDFQLHFWTRNFIVIEDIKSDARFEIDRLFREHNISIPFPQRDVWIKKED